MPTEKTIEERYVKVDQVEHILLRPDSYVGSTELHTSPMWVWDNEQEMIVNKTISFVPGLYKIFDEILVNAADNRQRDNSMKYIKVWIDRERGSIKVRNDGNSIPISIHKEHGVYVAQLIFGELLTSDNFDDQLKRVTGGRNGYGAKLTNIFSKKFTVKTGEKSTRKRLQVSWSSNMSVKSECVITSVDRDSATDFVEVEFTPDLSKFKMACLDDDIISLMTKRVYDLGGSIGSSVKISLNGTVIGVNSFAAYIKLYFKKEEREQGGRTIIVDKSSVRWEVAVTTSDSQTFQQVSFVNSICTSKGGNHVNAVTDLLVAAVSAKVKTKNRGGMDIRPAHIKSHLWVFVNCLIENPAFDSQTKDTLTSKPSNFGSKVEFSQKSIDKLLKSGVVESVLRWAQARQNAELGKKMKTGGGRNTARVVGLPKLEDANDAGTKKGRFCTLILTEGDSAKTSCVAGLSVVGRDKYGVFPLRGKLLNVREAAHNSVANNAEIKAILTALGLQVNKQNVDPTDLRYGSVMIMTDQDHDGSHIKGLIINLFHHFWPSLLRHCTFLKEFVTPIVKVTKKKTELCFFTLPEYDAWKKTITDLKTWRVKYYKGLGTSTDKEFQEYFRQINHHQIQFTWSGDGSSDAIDMAFNKKRADERKDWIQGYEEGTFVDHSNSTLSYDDFINKELVLFSRYDTERSIPSLCDGLKPGQRKVLFAVFKRQLKTELKVAQLGGYVAEVSCYHHGEQSLTQTIINMAQTYVGSNNINLLQPCGQFGSRKEGGKDASAARYIFTHMTKWTRKIFHPDDDAVLEYINEEGFSIEPKYYIPVIPMVLVNGAEGIGTGWSSFIPNFNPREIVINLKRYLRGIPLEPMIPWYRGYAGKIEKTARGIDSVGIWSKLDETTIVVTELPIRTWTQSYKEFLEGLITGGDDKKETGGDKKDDKRLKAEPILMDFRDNSGHINIQFTLKFSPEKMEWVESQGVEKVLRLRSSLPMTNMTVFAETGKVYRYETEIDILREFARTRLLFYGKRKNYLESRLLRQMLLLSNKVKFIKLVVEETIKINKKKKTELVTLLESWKLMTMSQINATSPDINTQTHESNVVGNPNANEEEQSDRDAGEQQSSVAAKEYDYLLGLYIYYIYI
eukprot:GHVR01013499.1.p1 GENE.GHVR01013499.1~~GHVR01013499.1.p1  ORF type:complete len:1130 (-),score=230.37 GHVR01013499.1:99-3488(-)